MRVTRNYINQPLAVGDEIQLPTNIGRHLRQVLRLECHDHCCLFNGNGINYTAQIIAVKGLTLSVRVMEAQSANTESDCQITLVQAIARGEKMDSILRKATELGVHTIVPLISDRTEVRLIAERLEKRMTHWQHVLIAASEQCGRAQLPHLTQPSGMTQVGNFIPSTGIRCALEPSATCRLDHLDRCLEVTLVVGPEGGWSGQDRQLLSALGFTEYRFGPRILRVETAGVAAIAVLQARFGDC